MANYKLRYLIDADDKAAKQKVRELDGMFTRMGVDAGSSLRKLAGPAAIASGAIAAIGAAAVAATKGLFDLTREAAAYGSEISDITDKTGLGAKTITTLKLAADLGGSSIEAMTSGLSRFAKKVGDAADGSKEAAADIAELGISPKEAFDDLDGALETVFARIMEAPPGVARTSLAMKAFGKSGADLIPVIATFNGDLKAFKQHAEDLGVTLTDETARAMDKFDDTMKQLDLQMKGVKSTIAESFLPVFQDMATATSDWLKTNKDEIRVWGQASADVLTGLIEYWRDLKKAADDYHASEYFKQIGGGAMNFMASIPGTPTWALRQMLQRGQDARNRFPDPTAEQLAMMPAGSGIAGGRRFGDEEEAAARAAELSRRTFQAEGQLLKEWERAGKAHLEKMRVEWERHFDERLITAEQFAAGIQEIENIFVKAQGDLLTAERDRALSRAQIGAERLAIEQKYHNDMDAMEAEHVKRVEAANKRIDDAAKRSADEQLKQNQRVYQQSMEMLEARRDLRLSELRMDRQLGAITESQFIQLSNTEAISILKIRRERALAAAEKHEADVLDLQIRRAQKDAELELMTAERKRSEARAASWKKYIDDLAKANALENATASRAGRAAIEAGAVTAPGTLLGGIAQGMGVNLVPMFKQVQDEYGNMVDVMLSETERLEAVKSSINDLVGNSIGGMIAGLSEMGAAWLATGQFSAQAALQMLSASAMNIAGQSAFKAIFEYAEGTAALATTWGLPNAKSIAHFAAAKMYLKTAAIAGGFGVGFGVGARAAGGGGGRAGAGDAGGTGFRGRDIPPDPLSRSSDDAFISGRRMDPATAALARAVEKLDKKISGMSAGDVLVAGSRQRRGFIAARVAADIKADATAGVRLGRSLQLR